MVLSLIQSFHREARRHRETQLLGKTFALLIFQAPRKSISQWRIFTGASFGKGVYPRPLSAVKAFGGPESDFVFTRRSQFDPMEALYIRVGGLKSD